MLSSIALILLFAATINGELDGYNKNLCGRPALAPGFTPHAPSFLLKQDVHEHPWAIQVKIGSAFCGGTLIDKRWVLTAAHCFLVPDPDTNTLIFPSDDSDLVKGLTLLLGGYQRDDYEEKLSAEKVIRRKTFSTSNTANDIALIKLDKDVEYTEKVRPVCLPKATPRVPSDNFLVIGWGVINKQAEHASKLMKNTVSLGSMNKDCKRNQENALCGKWNMGGADTCQGDSGGPLLKQSKGAWTQVGIVSYGLDVQGLGDDVPKEVGFSYNCGGNGCQECGYGGVYTDVAGLKGWIEEHAK